MSTRKLVERPAEAEFRPLVQALLSQLPEAEQVRKMAAVFSTEKDSHDLLDGLFIIRNCESKQPEFAVWAHTAPGATALLGFPQRIRSTSQLWQVDWDVPREIQTQLLAQAVAWAANQPIDMLQAVADPHDSSYHAVLVTVGLEKLVDLLFVASPELDLVAVNPSESVTAASMDSDFAVRDRPSIPPVNVADAVPKAFELGEPHVSPTWTLECVPPKAENLRRWSRVLELTYENSLDCPRINGKRAHGHTIAGYQATAHYLERGWLIVRSAKLESQSTQFTKDAKSNDGAGSANEAQDTGCLILADQPEDNFIELIYFGISSVARGQGLGKFLLNQAQEIARRIGRQRVIAAVDRKNLPALRAYDATGYTAIEEKTIFAKFFGKTKGN